METAGGWAAATVAVGTTGTDVLPGSVVAGTVVGTGAEVEVGGTVDVADDPQAKIKNSAKIVGATKNILGLLNQLFYILCLHAPRKMWAISQLPPGETAAETRTDNTLDIRESKIVQDRIMKCDPRSILSG